MQKWDALIEIVSRLELTTASKGETMHTIQTQVQITSDRILSIPLPEDMAEGTYQVVIVMNPQPANQLDEDDTPDEVES